MTLYIAMSVFALSMSISPGPVNLICLSSGINYGAAKTMSFVSGATIGFTLLLLLIGLGLNQAVTQYPLILEVMSILGGAFIIYMGIKTYRAEPNIQISKSSQPKFIEGFLLQWLNPKAWIACLAGISMFVENNNHQLLITFCSLYFLICYPSITAWAVLGNTIQSFFLVRHKAIIFNKVMGITLIMLGLYLAYRYILPPYETYKQQLL